MNCCGIFALIFLTIGTLLDIVAIVAPAIEAKTAAGHTAPPSPTANSSVVNQGGIVLDLHKANCDGEKFFISILVNPDKVAKMVFLQIGLFFGVTILFGTMVVCFACIRWGETLWRFPITTGLSGLLSKVFTAFGSLVWGLFLGTGTSIHIDIIVNPELEYPFFLAVSGAGAQLTGGILAFLASRRPGQSGLETNHTGYQNTGGRRRGR